MCGKIMQIWKGKVVCTTRYVVQAEFLAAIKEAVNDGEPISIKVTSTDKNFRKECFRLYSDR